MIEDIDFLLIKERISSVKSSLNKYRREIRKLDKEIARRVHSNLESDNLSKERSYLMIKYKNCKIALLSLEYLMLCTVSPSYIPKKYVGAEDNNSVIDYVDMRKKEISAEAVELGILYNYRLALHDGKSIEEVMDDLESQENYDLDKEIHNLLVVSATCFDGGPGEKGFRFNKSAIKAVLNGTESVKRY